MNIRNKNRFLYGAAIILAAPLFLASCTQPKEYVEGQMFAMDTYMTWKILEDSSGEVGDGIQKIIQNAEEMLSAADPSSETSHLNASAGSQITVSQELAEVIERSLSLANETEGALNPALYPLTCLWGFPTENPKVPSAEEITAILPSTDWRKVSVSENQVFLPKGMALDFGAVGKGYVTDLCVSYLKQNEISSALLSLGGNIYAYGGKEDGSEWQIGIELPFSDGAYAGVLSCRDSAIVTSGDYQRYFEEDGKRYHHILDGSTGFPADTGLDSVTIISSDGFLADALSTAYFVMGPEKSQEDWRRRENIEVVWITTDREVYYTEGLEGSFTVSEGLSSHVISR